MGVRKSENGQNGLGHSISLHGSIRTHMNGFIDTFSFRQTTHKSEIVVMILNMKSDVGRRSKWNGSGMQKTIKFYSKEII